MLPIRLAVVAGARPNFMKIAPLMKALAGDPDFDAVLIHTGQHYDDNMSGSFFRDLGIPEPQHHLEVGSGSHAQQTAEIMRRIEPVLDRGEAGCDHRCRRRELYRGRRYRRQEAAASTWCTSRRDCAASIAPCRKRSTASSRTPSPICSLITEESGRVNLLREGIAPERIHLVGNLMIDSLRQNVERAKESDIADRLGIGGMTYGVVTLHRPANVDDPAALEEIMGALRVIAENTPLFWPVHPRTRARLESGTLPLPREMRLLEPLGYLDFLSLEAGASVVLTDSGGIQEETTVLGVNCLTLRDNTERPVTIELGTNRLAGTKKTSILAAWDDLQRSPRQAQIPPLWDGEAGVRCREVLRRVVRLGRATVVRSAQGRLRLDL